MTNRGRPTASSTNLWRIMSYRMRTDRERQEQHAYALKQQSNLMFSTSAIGMHSMLKQAESANMVAEISKPTEDAFDYREGVPAENFKTENLVYLNTDSTNYMKIVESLAKPQLDKAVKLDDGKTDWSLLPIDSVEEILKVLEFGKNKYAAHNWCKGNGFLWTRPLNACLRHLFAWARGEDKDPESGISHLAHAGCNILFLLHFTLNKERYNQDDRYKPND